MSWFKLIIAGLCLALTACEFEPMYAPHNSLAPSPTIHAIHASIDISNIPDQEGQYLRNLLMDRIYTNGQPADAPYRLTFTPLIKETVNLGIRSDATATRAQMQITANMQLVDKASNKVLLSRTLKAVGAYNLLDNQLATITSQRHVTESVLQEISNDALTELDLYFRRSERP